MLAADNGDAAGYANATHEAIGPMLGVLRDSAAYLGNVFATGDANDEDGVIFSTLRVGQSATMTVHVSNAPAGAKLDAWIDFGRDNNWTTVGDQIVDNLAVVAGDNVVTFNVPVAALSRYAYARVRLSTAGNLNSTGAALDGEVEDYLVSIAHADSGPFTGQQPVAFNALSLAVTTDLDSDGDLDFVHSGGTWIENLDGVFGAESQLAGVDLGSRIVAAADLDQDGDVDLFSFERWYENNGSQKFTSHFYDLGSGGLTSLSIVDLDEDGDLDLLAATGNLVAWYENDGNEAFAARTISNSAASARSAVAVDMDDDGDLDVLVASSGDQTVEWYENDAHQVFVVRGISTAAGNVQAANAADLDDDGDLDVIAAVANGGVVWYENDGAQIFTPHALDAAAWTALSIAVADLDGDGDLDVAASGTNKVAWYENDGDQLFTNRTLAAASGIHYGVTAADFDGDGRLDVATNGTGTTPIAWFRQIADYDYGDAPRPYRVFLQDNAARHNAAGPRLGSQRDVETEGAHAPAGAEAEDDGVTFGTVQVGQPFGTVTVNVQSAPAGAKLDAWIDFDGDGSWGVDGEQVFAAIPVVEGENLLAFAVPSWAVAGATYARFRLSTAGGLGANGAALDGEVEDHPLTIAPREPSTGLFGDANSIAIGGADFMVTADVDGDGDVDVATKSAGAIAWHENLGAGTFVTHAVGASGIQSEDFLAGDLDSDGDVDFVGIGISNGNVAWLENDGQQNFTRRQSAPGSAAGNSGVALADMDGDGDMDVLAANLTTQASAYLMVNNGHQQFTRRLLAVVDQWGTSVLPVDLDQDGDLDVIVGGQATGASTSPDVAFLQNNGSLTFLPRTIKPRTPGSYSITATEGVAVGDMDGDGDLDVVAAGVAGSHTSPTATLPSLSWHEQIEGNQFVAHNIDFGRNLRWATLGDIDGDGDLDILTAGWTNSVDVYENAAGRFNRRTLAQAQSALSSAALTDIDGDGDLDAVAMALVGPASVAWFENFDLVDPDYGDAPGPYPTTRADDGPLHNGGGPRLGALRDEDADGAPTPGADGDAGDDGVTLPAIRVGQSSATVTVNVQNAPAGARLDAWIDFNGDGSWGGAGEQILAGAPVVEGDNVLAFNVLVSAVAGQKYARFRLSSTGGLRPGGAALDGEVEDYTLAIEAPAPSTAEYGAASRVNGTTFFNQSPVSVFTDDIDGDGDPDLVQSEISSGSYERFAWYENLGDGAYLGHLLGGQYNNQTNNTRPIDLDGDGDVDFVGFYNSTLAWHENNGAESFNFRPSAASTSTFPLDSRFVYDLADVDGDGDLDGIVAGTGQLLVVLNDGSQNFGPALPLSAPLNAGFYDLRAADIDGDGDIDVAAALTTGLAWLENQSGAFVLHTLGVGATGEVSPVDFDGDGDLDLVAASWNSPSIPSVDWWDNDGQQVFVKRTLGLAPQFSAWTPNRGANELATGDLDGDGDLDAVLAMVDRYWLFRNDREAGFSRFQVPTLYATYPSLAVADFDGDGAREIVGVGLEGSGASLFLLDDLAFGDYDRNGSVNGADLLVWQRTLGQPGVPPGSGADGDRSGVVDSADLAVWQANVGRSPEPQYQAADFDQNERIDGNDFLTWQRRLGTTYPYPGGPPGSADADFSRAVDAGDLEVWKRQFGQGVLLDQAWINAPDNVPSEAASAPPALAANVILSLDPAPAASVHPTVVARSAYRPLPSAGVARDAALAQWFPFASTDAAAPSDAAISDGDAEQVADDLWAAWPGLDEGAL